ncbi:MAG TPA: tetratricopeptide repeat protein [Polyangia bacterium]|nr:tetratricopeptide repeat protein [Polyangia bacterium]
MTRAFSAALTLSVLMIAGSGVARAGDPNAEKARAHFQQGDTFFKLDKYAPALQEFEQAYLAKQDPSFLYNIAQCHRLMGNRVEAIRFYKRYINDAPTAPNRPVAEKHIHDLEAAIEADHLVGSRPAPPPPPVPVSPVPPPPGAATPPPTPSGSAPPPSPPLALNATPPPPSDTVLTNSPAGPSPSDEHPIYTKWWFWTAIGGVVVTGVILTLLLNRDPSCPSGWQCQ